MQKVRTWPLYGSAVYMVEQKFTSDFPAKCWLLVNKDGIHISEPFRQEVIKSHSLKTLTNVTADESSVMIVADGQAVKYVFETSAVCVSIGIL